MNKNKILWGVVLLLGTLAIGTGVWAYSGTATTVIEHAENVTIQSPGALADASLLGSSSQTLPTYLVQSDDYTSLPSFYLWNTEGGLEVEGATYFSGSFNYRDTMTALTVTTTLLAAQTGETFLISGATSTWTLPTTTSLTAGTKYMFRTGGAFTATSSIVVSGGVNLIEGTLIVAGAVVDCDAEDTLTFGGTLENIGDYVELIWSGTYWLLGDSGVLTAGALTCTAS